MKKHLLYFLFLLPFLANAQNSPTQLDGIWRSQDTLGLSTHNLTTKLKARYDSVRLKLDVIRFRYDSIPGLDTALANRAKVSLINSLTASIAGKLSDPGGNGFVSRTAAGTTINRTITGTAGRITVSNGTGVAANPVIDVGADVLTTGGAATVTNKIMSGTSNTFSNVPQSAISLLSDTLAAQRLRLKDSLQVVRDRTGFVLVNNHGGGKNRTGAQNKAAFLKALARAKLTGVKVVRYSDQTYIQDPIDLTGSEVDSITIDLGASKINMSTATGDAIFKFRGVKGVILKGNGAVLDVNNSTAAGAGGVWMSGDGNYIDGIEVRNGDGFSIIVAGSYSNGLTFVPTTTRWNTVNNCITRGQKRYHSIGAKASLMAADSAAHTVISNCKAIDNFVSGETGDYFDVDHAVDTRIFNCLAVKTTAGYADGAGLHLEGEQNFPNMTVKVEGFTAINFTKGISVSQNIRARFSGQNFIYHCKKAIDNYAVYTQYFSNFLIDDCGEGYETSDIEGAINNSRTAEFDNIVTRRTRSKYALLNYNGSALNSTQNPLKVRNFDLDKPVQASFTNVGSYKVFLSGGTFRKNSGVNAYNNTGLELEIFDALFDSSSVAIARSKRVTINHGIFSGPGSGTAVINTLDNHKTTILNSSFNNYSYVHNGFASYGFGNDPGNVTNKPVKPEDMLMKGQDNTRSNYYGNWTDELPSGVWTTPGNISGAPFSSAFPFVRLVFHESNGNSSLGNPAGFWNGEIVYNIKTGPMYWRRHDATEGWGPWEPITTLPTAITSVANGQFLKYNGTNWVNSHLSTDQDIVITDATKGVVFKKPDGSGCYRMTIDNAGAPVFTAITCP